MTGARIVLTGGGTGGHLYPALNLADALRRADSDVELLYVGSLRGLEARVLPSTDLEHRLLPVGPLYRSRPWRSWRTVLGAPAAAAGALAALRSFRPDAVVGTGGYASGPATLAALLRGVPLALQEQNAAPGLVTRWMARRADQVHLGFPEARQALQVGPDTEVLSHGNPVARPGTGEPTIAWPDGRVLLVVGGSQGARGLNQLLLEDLRQPQAWPPDLSVVWIAGREHADELAAEAARLPWSDRVLVVPYVEELARQLDRVTLAVGRAGAMFVSELATAGVPSILVPFPSAAGGHQRSNAAALAGAGAAVVREEAELGPGQLWNLAAHLLADRERLARMARAAVARGAPDAADRIARDLLRLAAEGEAMRAAGSPGHGERGGRGGDAAEGGDGRAEAVSERAAAARSRAGRATLGG